MVSTNPLLCNHMPSPPYSVLDKIPLPRFYDEHIHKAVTPPIPRETVATMPAYLL